MLYQDQILDEYERPVPGAKVHVFTPAGETVSLTDEHGLALENPVVSDDFGVFYFVTADGAYELEVHYVGKIEYKQEINVGPLPTGPPGPPGDVSKANTRAQMAAIGNPQSGTTVFLTEAGREGMFVWSTANLSAKVTADTAQGLFVAPTSAPTGAGGAWVRKFDGPVCFDWFGAVKGENGGLNGPANNAAWAALGRTLTTLATNATTTAQGVFDIRFGLGPYEFTAPLDCNFGTVHLMGCGSGGDFSAATKLKFYNCSGLITQNSDTSGQAGVGGTHISAIWSVVENIAFSGNHGDTLVEAEYHGVVARSSVHLRNVSVRHFAGNGFHLAASGSLGGTVDNSTLIGCRALYNRNGFFADGGDGNVISFINCMANSNRQWGFWDSSLLGNHYESCETNSNGGVDGDSAPCAVWDGTNSYFVIAGQEAWASANPPSGTTADNQGWAWWKAGRANAALVAWTARTYRSGGSYCADSIVAPCTYVGCYAETGQPYAQLSHPSMVFGGQFCALIWKGSSATVLEPRSTASAPILGVSNQIQVDCPYVTDEDFSIVVGSHNSSKIALSFSGSNSSPDNWRLKGGNDVLFDYDDTSIGFRLTGPNTAQQFGTGVNFPFGMYIPALFLGGVTADPTLARRVALDNAAPATGTHAKGEFIFNRAAAAGAPNFWQNYALGTPGTWQALYCLNQLQAAGSGLTVSATDKILGRQAAGGGAVEEITCTAAGRALLDDADATAQRASVRRRTGGNRWPCLGGQQAGLFHRLGHGGAGGPIGGWPSAH